MLRQISHFFANATRDVLGEELSACDTACFTSAMTRPRQETFKRFGASRRSSRRPPPAALNASGPALTFGSEAKNPPPQTEDGLLEDLDP